MWTVGILTRILSLSSSTRRYSSVLKTPGMPPQKNIAHLKTGLRCWSIGSCCIFRTRRVAASAAPLENAMTPSNGPSDTMYASRSSTAFMTLAGEQISAQLKHSVSEEAKATNHSCVIFLIKMECIGSYQVPWCIESLLRETRRYEFPRARIVLQLDTGMRKSDNCQA